MEFWCGGKLHLHKPCNTPGPVVRSMMERYYVFLHSSLKRRTVGPRYPELSNFYIQKGNRGFQKGCDGFEVLKSLSDPIVGQKEFFEYAASRVE